MKDIETTYEHKYKTRFIIDNSRNYDSLMQMDLSPYCRIFIVIDENVHEIYGQVIIGILGKWKKEICIHKVKPSEESKSISYYPTLVSFFEEHTAGRYDAVVAVGGGIVIDLVSFTVSTYMRGLPLFIIATTLIGQTDASTAGKTCLNSLNAKNLLGTFYYPITVYNSIEIMKSCSSRITRQGLSEAFKYSLLTDGRLLDTIVRYQNSDRDDSAMEEIVRKTIESRIAIRKVDPLASNLGHTFGHALEKYFDYKILHGDAILIGTVMAMDYAVRQSLMDEGEREKIFNLMQRAHLNTFISQDFDVHRLVTYMRKDKKSSAEELHLVMIHGIGKPYRGETPFYPAGYDEIEDFLSEWIRDYPYKAADYIAYVDKEML